MTSDERKQKIEAYRTGYQQLMAALSNFPLSMWQFRPAEHRWTIHEIIIHIADSEANSYIRCRRFLAEPGSAVLGYAETKWAQALDYHGQNPQAALDLFKLLRQQSYELIRDLPEETWFNTVNHSESGLMTMETWLDTYARHIPDHIQQMRLVYLDWVKTNFSTGGLIAEIETAWGELQAFLTGLNESQMIDIHDDHGWNVRDHITHLAAWEQSVLFLFQGKPRHLALGISEEKFANHNIDETNAFIRELKNSYSIGEALQEFGEIHASLLEQVRLLTDAEVSLLVVQFFAHPQAGDSRRVFEIIRQNTAGHFLEHLGWMKTLVS